MIDKRLNDVTTFDRKCIVRQHTIETMFYIARKHGFELNTTSSIPFMLSVTNNML